MNSILIWTARIAGAAGVAATLLAFAGRLGEVYRLAGFQVGTVLQAGIAAMLLACLAYLVVLAERPR